MKKEEIERMMKAGFIREKKNRTKTIDNIKFKEKEISGKKLSEFLTNRKIIFQGYGYAIVSKKKSK